MAKKADEVTPEVLEKPSMVKVFVKGTNLPDVELNDKCMSSGTNDFKTLIVPLDIAEFYLKKNSSIISSSSMEPVQDGNCIICNNPAKVIEAEKTKDSAMATSCPNIRTTYCF